MHDAGGAIALQVLHAGRYGYHPLSQSASDKKSPITPFKPSAMSSKEVDHTATAFARSVALARKAGYDAVEIMGSEGYLINQFLAARTNDRDDQWGGSAARRMHFAVEVVRRSRELVGDDFPIVYRISLLDLVEGGQTWEETAELALHLQAAGVTVFNTGIGWHEARVPTIITQVPRGAWRSYTARLKQVVDVPVCASNRINTPELAEDILAAGEADLVSMARPLLADPAFVAKAMDERADEINTCIACNQACLDHVFANERASCLVNPRACHETELVLMPTLRKQTVAVVGAGPAGLAAATSAAERGFAVTLFEKSPELGGQFRLAMAVPGKEDFADTLRYFTRRLEVLGVDVRLSTEATADDLAGFDQVVVATGVEPRIPEIPGIDHPSVASYADVLSGAVVPGKRVAVIGAGGIGVDVSVFLTHEEEDLDDWMAHWGVGDPALTAGGLTEAKPRTPAREVTLVQRKTTPIGIGLGKTSGWAHRAVLKQSKVTQVSGATYDRIDDDGLHVTVDGVARVIEADTIVVCAGQDSVRGALRRPRPRRRTSSAAPTSPPSSTPSARSSRAPRSSRGCEPGRRPAIPWERRGPPATMDVRNTVPAQQPPWADSYAPGVPLHLDYGDTTVLDLWDDAVRHHGDRPAVDFLGRVSTYAEVDEEVRRVAGGLHALGVRPGDNVALVMPNCPQNVIAFFAVLRLGAAVVEHNPLYTAAELRRPFVDHGARVAIVWDKVVPVVEELVAGSALEHVVAVDMTTRLPWRKRLALRLPIAKARTAREQLTAPAPQAMQWADLASAAPLGDSHPRPHRDDVALLLYTSGTTGVPKGVPLLHRNLVANVMQGRAWVPGLQGGRGVLPGGAAAVPRLRRDGERAARRGPRRQAGAAAQARDRPDHGRRRPRGAELRAGGAAALPAHRRRVAAPQRLDQGHPLRTVRGDATARRARRALGGCHGRAARGGLRPHRDVTGDRRQPDDRRAPAGCDRGAVPRRGDPHRGPGRPRPRGAAGRARRAAGAGSAGLRGLPGPPDETAAAFHDGWFRTGDVVTMSPDGFLTIVDRIKEVIITGGFNVYPSEVEAVLRTHAGVVDVAVVGLPARGRRRGGRRRGGARGGRTGRSRTSCAAHTRQGLTPYKVPRRVVFVEELPTNPMGKVLRREVVARLRDPRA